MRYKWKLQNSPTVVPCSFYRCVVKFKKEKHKKVQFESKNLERISVNRFGKNNEYKIISLEFYLKNKTWIGKYGYKTIDK